MKIIKNRVLIAEKDAVISKNLSDILIGKGFIVEAVVDNAIDAITKSNILKPDLIILGVLLHGALSGIEAAKIISYKNDVRIIFLADKFSINLLKKDSNFGSSIIIDKLLNPKDILNAIERTNLIPNYNDLIKNSIDSSQRDENITKV